MTDFHRHAATSRIFGICLALSIALHGALLVLMGYGLRPFRVKPQVKQPPLQVVLLPPPAPKPPAAAPAPPRPRQANPLPPSTAPRVARQTIKTRVTTPTRRVNPTPVPNPRVHTAAKPPPQLHLLAKPEVPRPSEHAPGASAVATRTALAPPRTLTTPSPAPTAAPPDAPAGGVAPDAGSGTGRQGEGTGSESGTGTGSGSGNGDGGGGSAPYWPFGIDTGDAGGGGPRHVVYILDISASMESRIAQARQEIAAAIDSLQPGETFDIVAFDERGQSFRDGLIPASPSNAREAKSYLNNLQLGPGTNLEAALRIALKIPGANVVVLVTDGVPTVGEQSWKKLEKIARDLNRGETARIFAIGLVGKNPDGTDDSFEATKLLQKLSADSGGKSTIYSLGVAMPQ